MSRCYVCQVQDPNDIHFSPELHHICMICGVKLWELAQHETKLEIREQTIRVTSEDAGKKKTQSRKEVLTTSYEVELAEEQGLEHLFSAIIGETMTRLQDSENAAARRWAAVYDACICEIHYIGGQLHFLGSNMDIEFLLDEFGVHWDMLAEKLR